MLEPLHARGIPVTFHSDGMIEPVIPLIISLGFCSLNPLEPYGMNIYDIKRRFGDRICLVGNLDIAGPLAFGTPEEVRRDTIEHLERLAPGGGYVCARQPLLMTASMSCSDHLFTCLPSAANRSGAAMRIPAYLILYVPPLTDHGLWFPIKAAASPCLMVTGI